MGTRIGIVLSAVLLAMTLAGCVRSALYNAAERGDTQAVRTLLDQGTPVNETTSHDTTALIVAARKGHADVVRLLLDRGADVNAKDTGSYTALHGAAVHGHLGIAQLLLEHGADTNTTYTDPLGGKYFSKATPLHMAARDGQATIVQMLLAHGADCCRADGHGKTPLKLAQEKGQTTAARLLEQAEAKQLAAISPPTAAPSGPASPAPPPASIPASDVDALPALRAKMKPNAYAVVIGIESYREKLPKADFADRDAKLVGDYLTKVMGYPEQNVVVRLNERATRTDLVKYFEDWLRNNVEAGGSVFVYYSGHGAPNPKTGDAYLVPYDGDPAFVDSTAYPLKQLYAALNKLPANDVTVVLDACFSGAGGRSVIAEGARPMMLSVENPVLAGNKTLVLAASSGTQISSTFKEQGHGLLTYYFLKGLQGGGDLNRDGAVEMKELFEYLKPQVQRVARKQYNNEQTPQLLGSPELLTKGVRLVERAP